MASSIYSGNEVRRRLFFNNTDNPQSSDIDSDDEWVPLDDERAVIDDLSSGFSSTTHSTTSVSSGVFDWVRSSSDDEVSSDDESGAPTLPKPKAEAFEDDFLGGIGIPLSLGTGFSTPPSSAPSSPQKTKNTPSPVKTAVKTVREYEGSPSKLPHGDRVVEGLRSTFRTELEEDKAKEVQERVVTLVVGFLFKGEEPDSPKGHEFCIVYIKTLEWVEDFFDIISRERIPCRPIFDTPHLRGEISPTGKLSGGHFQGPGLVIESSVTSVQKTTCAMWTRVGASEPKRSSIFPLELTPKRLISEFSDSPVKACRGNRSLRVIDRLCVEAYHRGPIIRSAFPTFIYHRLEIGSTYPIMEGVSLTTDDVLGHVVALNATAFDKDGVNPIEFINKKAGFVVVNLGSRFEIPGADKGVYFEIPESMIKARINAQDYEDLVEEVI